MHLFWLRQMRPARTYHMTVFPRSADSLLHMRFNTIEIEGRQKFAIGHGVDAVFMAANAYKQFCMRIPGRDLIVTDRPFNTITIFRGCSKFIFAPALAGPAPGERFAAYLVATYPVERFFLYVRM